MNNQPSPSAGLRPWLALSVSVLLAAGAMAVLLVFARMPPFDQLVTDPAFFRRALVVHVVLALVVWFVAFATGLTFLLPRAGAPWTRAGAGVATVGVGLLFLAAGVPGAEPVLANYIPMIDHPLFAAGLVTFGAGVLLAVSDLRLWPAPTEGALAAAAPGLRVVVIGLFLVALTAVGSWMARPLGEIDALGFWEVVNWGPGHVLQLVSEAAMVAGWLLLAGDVLGRPAVRPAAAALGFGLLLLPWLGAPLLTLLPAGASREGFTTMMRWGLFPVVTVFAVAIGRALAAARRAGQLGERPLADPRVSGFLVSAGLTALGFVLGALIRGSNTVVPAHYHAAIGAVTAAFMALTPGLLDRLALPAAPGRAARWQPLVYGLGQMVFAIGFAIAGAHGTARKVYGAEQTRGAVETLGLGVMGVGGLVAVMGGLLFLWVVLARVRRALTLSHTPPLEVPPWPSPIRGTRSSV